MGREKDIFISFLVGVVWGAITYYCFTEEGTYSAAYKTMLSDVWIVFAGWLPMMILTLSILISNSERVLIRLLSKTGKLSSFIDDIAICTVFILLSAVLLFLHGASSSGWLYTFICTSAIAMTISYFGFIFYSIMLIGKTLPKADKAAINRKETNQ